MARLTWQGSLRPRRFKPDFVLPHGKLLPGVTLDRSRHRDFQWSVRTAYGQEFIPESM